MNDEEFVDAIKEHVFDSAIESVMSQIISPSGRKPRDTLLQLNNWFHEQDEEAQSRIRQCVKEGAHAALFGILCVLDGVRLIHEDLRSGQLDSYSAPTLKRLSCPIIRSSLISTTSSTQKRVCSKGSKRTSTNPCHCHDFLKAVPR